MKKAKLGCAIFGLIAVAMASGACKPSGSPQEEATPVPPETIAWAESSEGFSQLKTNDPANLDHYFTLTSTLAENPMVTPVSVQLKKVSGSTADYLGYGIVFCRLTSTDFYELLIDANGHYAFLNNSDGMYDHEYGWDSSPDLNKGLGAENLISVAFDGVKTFTVSFNGRTQAPIAIKFGAAHTGGTCGFIATVGDSSQESFPGSPADYRFKMSTPYAIP